MNLNNYQQYKAQTVNTMTNGEMLMLLFDELVKRLKRAELALGQGDYPLFDASVQRSTEIIRYLKSTLKREYNISSQLRSLYDFFLFELSRAKAGRKAETIREILPLVDDLRGAFREAAKNTNM